ncbi:DoxX family protein [Spongiibacter sp. KMU-158]|uniref:DoxX family protein n=1 Tax=Spongiibacter pelagi TaxID=2760804 RepID=A0A927GW56_9GAMM|nr:DoxX family protein [Spongiibacter pelagi]MBD2858079.1 DoxX family protein [Spongiibacter pelagi]
MATMGMLILQLLFIVLFGIAAIFKFIRHPHMVEEFEKFEYPYWLAYVAASAEIIAISLLIAGFFYPAATALGALVLFCTMLGAAAINFIKRPASYGIGVLIIAALCLWLASSQLDSLNALIA